MVLCVNIGNENISLGVFDSEKLRFTLRAGTDLKKTEDEYIALFNSLLSVKGVSGTEIEGCALSSVVPHLTSVIFNVLREIGGKEPITVTAGIKTGLNIRTDNPAQIGADIVCMSVAAIKKGALPAVIVSADAATVFAAVDKNKSLLGCSIAPGITTSADALTKNAALLSAADCFQRPDKAIGTGTEQSILSGVVIGFAALIDGLAGQIASEMGGECSFIMTGCPSSVLSFCRLPFEVDDGLILKGLFEIYKKN